MDREEEGPGVCSAPGPSLGWSRLRGLPTQSAQIAQALCGVRVDSSTVVFPPCLHQRTQARQPPKAGSWRQEVSPLSDLLGLPLHLVVSLPPCPR